MAEDPRAKYGLSCPSGGSFYICGAAETQFIGCCDHDPCSGGANGICEDGALHPATFSSANYVDIGPQSCVEPYDEHNWWTCQNANPPFLGCCKSNPCNAGCPDADLLPSRLSDNATNAAPLLSSTLSSPEPAAAAATKTPTGLIVGVTMGGLVILFAGIAAFLWRKRRKEKQQAASNEEAVQGQPQAPGGGDQPVMMGQQYSPYSPYKDSYPSTVHSSPYPYQSSVGMMSPPISTTSTCWSPRDGRFAHSRHTSQLSELSGDDYIHELPDGSALQTVPESGGGGQSAPGGIARPPRAYGGTPILQHHELEAGNR